MKEFYGAVSFSGRANFTVKAKDEETATNIVFDNIEGIQLYLKDGSTVEIGEVDWDLIERESNGFVATPYVSDFEIEEER